MCTDAAAHKHSKLLCKVVMLRAASPNESMAYSLSSWKIVTTVRYLYCNPNVAQAALNGEHAAAAWPHKQPDRIVKGLTSPRHWGALSCAAPQARCRASSSQWRACCGCLAPQAGWNIHSRPRGGSQVARRMHNCSWPRRSLQRAAPQKYAPFVHGLPGPCNRKDLPGCTEICYVC